MELVYLYMEWGWSEPQMYLLSDSEVAIDKVERTQLTRAIYAYIVVPK